MVRRTTKSRCQIVVRNCLLLLCKCLQYSCPEGGRVLELMLLAMCGSAGWPSSQMHAACNDLPNSDPGQLTPASLWLSFDAASMGRMMHRTRAGASSGFYGSCAAQDFRPACFLLSFLHSRRRDNCTIMPVQPVSALQPKPWHTIDHKP